MIVINTLLTLGINIKRIGKWCLCIITLIDKEKKPTNSINFNSLSVESRL